MQISQLDKSYYCFPRFGCCVQLTFGQIGNHEARCISLLCSAMLNCAQVLLMQVSRFLIGGRSTSWKSRIRLANIFSLLLMPWYASSASSWTSRADWPPALCSAYSIAKAVCWSGQKSQESFACTPAAKKCLTEEASWPSCCTFGLPFWKLPRSSSRCHNLAGAGPRRRESSSAHPATWDR